MSEHQELQHNKIIDIKSYFLYYFFDIFFYKFKLYSFFRAYLIEKVLADFRVLLIFMVFLEITVRLLVFLFWAYFIYDVRALFVIVLFLESSQKMGCSSVYKRFKITDLELIEALQSVSSRCEMAPRQYLEPRV